MDEDGNRDSDRAADDQLGRHQSDTVTDKDASSQSVREIVACCRSSEGKLFPGDEHTMNAEMAHRSHRPTTLNTSPPRTSAGHSDDICAQSATTEEQSNRLRTSGLAVESAADRDERVVSSRVTADSVHGLRVVNSPSQLAVKSPDQESKHSVTSSPHQSDGLLHRAIKSPPTSRITAFSVCDILDPAKFGCERRERADLGPTEPRLRPAAAPYHEFWSPWMQRLELQLRAGAVNINNFNFLRGIGQSSYSSVTSELGLASD